MCLLIVDEKGSGVPVNVAEMASFMNPDGYGRLCLETGKITKTMNMDLAVKLATKGGKAVHHFRYATVGTKGEHGCHPFPVSAGWWLFQNGTVNGLNISDNRPDTAHIADMLRHVDENRRANVLDKFASRFAIVNAKTKRVIRAGSGWTERDGLWYSNQSALEGDLVAVYGTLKSGNGNHGFLRDAEFYGIGHTKDKHRLCNHGIPYLIEGGSDGKQVEVEVYEVDKQTLDALDKLEGHPHHYNRRRTTVVVDGHEVSAWIYFAPEQYDNGERLECWGDSWDEGEIFGDGLIGYTCPECGSHDINAIEGFIACETCSHWETDSHEYRWRSPLTMDDFDDYGNMKGVYLN